jgi:hypothetical protein
VAEVTDEAVYLAMALKNVGSGLAVLDRSDLHIDRQRGDQTPRDPDDFTASGAISTSRPGTSDSGREPSGTDDPQFAVARDAITGSRHLTIDLLYGEHEGGQRMSSRFTMIPDHSGQWITSVGRHWNLDRPDPR